MAVARFNNGLSNIDASKTLSQFGALDPTKYHVFFDDFDVFDPTDALDWDVAAASGSVAVADGGNGTVLLTSQAADNALAQIATMAANFALVAGKKAWFKTKITAQSDATSQDVVIGLHSDDQSPVAGAPANGIYFRKDDTTTEWDLQIMNTSVSVAVDTNIATCTTGAITLGWAFDGVSNFEVFVSDSKVADIATTDFPTADLGVSLTVQAGKSSAATMTVDYIFAANER